ncbi:hypothetical protein HMSSN036_05950 [Paenibacillus macerans]|nr:hypothetical protein HMSSN036_05950 [Paenibacillus macerans]
MIERQKRSSKRKKKKLGKKSWIAIIAIVLIIGAGAYVFRKPLAIMAFDLFLSGQVEKQLQESYAPLGGETEPQQVAQEQGLEPFTMLLLGVDQRDKEPARSDTMIYAVVRPEEEKCCSFPFPAIRIRKLWVKAVWIRSTTRMLLAARKWRRTPWKTYSVIRPIIMRRLTFMG